MDERALRYMRAESIESLLSEPGVAVEVERLLGLGHEVHLVFTSALERKVGHGYTLEAQVFRVEPAEDLFWGVSKCLSAKTGGYDFPQVLKRLSENAEAKAAERAVR